MGGLRVRSGAAAGVMVVLLLAACSGGDRTPDATSSGPTAASTPTLRATATPTPAATVVGVVDRSDPSLGIMFEQIPDVTGAQAAALDTLMRFQVEFWRSRTDGTVSPAITDLATDRALAQVKDVVTTNAEDGWTTGGQITSTYDDVSGSTRLVVVDLCSDEREATYTKGGTVTSGVDLPTARQAVRAEVAVQPTGRWAVQTFAPGATC